MIVGYLDPWGRIDSKVLCLGAPICRGYYEGSDESSYKGYYGVLLKA